MAACLAPASAGAITVKVDYSFDASNFFGAGNPQGPAAGGQAKASLEAAAAYFSGILDDSFSPIVVPAPFHSATSNGIATWDWMRTFNNPSAGAQVSLTTSIPGETIAANQYIVYAGARNLASAGQGGPGGASWTFGAAGTFTAPEVSQITSITAGFQNQVERRGQTSGFESWGGAISFDSATPTPWHFDHAALPSAGTIDFYTIALHELAHTLGFGASEAWTQRVTGLSFNGPNAVASFGGPVPLADPAHWTGGLSSVVFGGATPQSPLMSAVAPNGQRSYFTNLDAAGMRDLGWTVVPEPRGAVMLVLGAIVVGVIALRRAATSGVAI